VRFFTHALAADETLFVTGHLNDRNVILSVLADGDATVVYEEPKDGPIIMGDYGTLSGLISGP